MSPVSARFVNNCSFRQIAGSETSGRQPDRGRATGQPLISGALSQWEGQISVFDPASGTPCYQCIFPEAPADGLAPSCAEAGVIGPLPGVIGSMMAVEAIKLITGAGQALKGEMLIYDALYGDAEVKDRKIADVPNDFMDDAGKLNKHAQAYFGLFKHLFDADFLTEKDLDNDKLVALAFSIDDVVNTAVAEYSINPAEIENAIHMKLLPMLFGDLGLDNAQKLIEEVLKITRSGLARG